jgi:FlaA1/EpsC-like NDP-sugar epimerase
MASFGGFMLKDKRVVVTGGTGSLGKVLVRRLLTGEMGMPRQITVFSRDEAKQHQMRLAFQHKRNSTDEVIYHNFEQLLQFRIGDVRDLHSVSTVLRDADTVFNAAALKQVPPCRPTSSAPRTSSAPCASTVCRSKRSSASRPTRPASPSTSWA